MTSLSEKSQVNFAPDKPPPVLPLEEPSTEWPESDQCPGTKFGTSVKTAVEGPIIELDLESTGTFTDSSEEEAK